MELKRKINESAGGSEHARKCFTISLEKTTNVFKPIKSFRFRYQMRLPKDICLQLGDTLDILVRP